MKIKDLKEICQSDVKGKDIWSWWNIQRRISIYFTQIFIFLKLSANQVTVLNLLFSLGGVYFLFLQNYLLAFILYQFYFIIDCSDGELARYYKTASGKGLFLDRMIHVISEPLLFLGLSSSIGRIELGIIPAICCENGLRLISWGYSNSTKTNSPENNKQSIIERIARFLAIYGFVWLIFITFVIGLELKCLLFFWSFWTPLACLYQIAVLWNQKN